MTAVGNFPKINGDVVDTSDFNKISGFAFGAGTFGDGNDGALHVTSGTTTISTQVKRYTSLTVDAGTTLAFSTFGKFLIYVQGDMTINGAISLGNRVGSALPTNVFDAVVPTNPNGGAAVNIMGLVFPSFIHKTPMEPAGGKGGMDSQRCSNGGGGGGSVGAGGTGGAPTLHYTNTGSGGAPGVGKCVVFFFVGGNVTYGASSSISGAGTNGSNSGGGGGGGGIVYTLCGKAVSLASGCSIGLQGGDGGFGSYDAGVPCHSGGGGGGGGGGWFVIYSDSYTSSATINVNGGAGGGSGGNPGAAGGIGANSAVKLCYSI